MAAVVVNLLEERGLSLSLAESMTGGLVACRIVDVPGSSRVLLYGAVAYSNESKVSVLGVSKETMRRAGAVSRQCALEMAEGARRAGSSDIGVSTTGIAGPGGGTPDKPVGLTYLGFVGPGFSDCEEFRFRWDRNRNRRAASIEALRGIIRRVGGA